MPLYTPGMSRDSTVISVLLAAWVALLSAGCASSEGPAVLTIEPSQYEAAFAAAAEAARREGMPAILRDPHGGVIETSPRIAGSILEPWRGDNASFAQAVDNTVSFQQRRARFEFVPADHPPVELPPTGALRGPDVAGLEARDIDLTRHDGPIEVRAIVSVESFHRPGLRRSTWSRRYTTQVQLLGPDEALPSGFWTPIARDEPAERRLLAAIQNVLQDDAQDAASTR